MIAPLFPAFSANSIQAGSVCPNSGVTKIYQGKKFTCIKSGKKLIWSKGVEVKVAAPLPSKSPSTTPTISTTTPTSTPTPTFTPTPTPSVSPSPTPTPTPTPTQTINRKKWELLYLKIWDAFDAAQNQGDFPFVYKFGPTVNRAKAQESIDAYAKAMKPWLVILNGAKTYPMYWSIMSEKDYDWWKRTVEEQEPDRPNYAWDPKAEMLGHCKLSSTVFCGYGTTFASNSPNYKFLQYNVIGSNYTQAPNRNTVHHEATHLYQLGVVQSFPNDTPCWYVEGQASLYGNALEWNLNDQRDRSIRQRENFKGIVRQYQPNADSYKTQDWVSVQRKMYWGHVSCSSEQDYFKYALGMFNWEYLIDNYGAEKMHKVLVSFNRGSTFKSSILENLGIDFDQLEVKMADNLADVFAGGN